MIAVWLLGIPLAVLSRAYMEGWLQLKFVLVLAMSGVHGMFARWAKDFGRDANTRSQRFYRMVNEVPTVLMVAIVILAVVKPF